MSLRVTAPLHTATMSLAGFEIVQWIGIWSAIYAGGRPHDKGGPVRSQIGCQHIDAIRGGNIARRPEAADLDARLHALVDQVALHRERPRQRHLASLDGIVVAGVGAQFHLTKPAGVGVPGETVELAAA